MEPSPPTLQLRQARPADAAKIAQCYLAARRTMLAFAPLTHADADTEAWVRDTLLPASQVTMALESGGVAGFIAVSRRVDGDWVDHLYVHPTRLRRGIGSTLLGVTLMRIDGTVRLYTFEQNRVARKFFERYGFTAVAFGDGSSNDSGSPDVLYERESSPH
jgi:ribosomal protein S18 acetylase RimI-like enzyme